MTLIEYGDYCDPAVLPAQAESMVRRQPTVTALRLHEALSALARVTECYCDRSGECAVCRADEVLTYGI